MPYYESKLTLNVNIFMSCNGNVCLLSLTRQQPTVYVLVSSSDFFLVWIMVNAGCFFPKVLLNKLREGAKHLHSYLKLEARESRLKQRVPNATLSHMLISAGES